MKMIHSTYYVYKMSEPPQNILFICSPWGKLYPLRPFQLHITAWFAHLPLSLEIPFSSPSFLYKLHLLLLPRHLATNEIFRMCAI